MINYNVSKIFENTSKRVHFGKVAGLQPVLLFKTTSSTTIAEGFCLLFRNSFLKENCPVVAFVITYLIDFISQTTIKCLSLTIKKYIRLSINAITRKQNENNNKLKLRLKLKFANINSVLALAVVSSTSYTNLLIKVYVKHDLVATNIILVNSENKIK